MTLPASITTGRVSGRFLIGLADREEDADQDPDIVPARGTITFTPSVPYLPGNATDPITIVPTAIKGVLDSEGFLCTPSSADPRLPRFRGVRLFATDNPELPVKNWTWTVSYSLTNPDGTSLGSSIPSHQISVLTGSDLDLTLAVRVPASAPLGVTQAEALVIAAKAEVDRLIALVGTGTGGTGGGGSEIVQAVDIIDSTDTGRALLKAVDKAAARFAIDAGTSSLALGVTANTAKAGNWQPSWGGIVDKPLTFPSAPHTHSQGDVGGLDSALAGKADAGHTHAISQIPELSLELSNRFRYRGPFVPGVTYKVNDVVTAAGLTFFALIEHVSANPAPAATSAYWQLMGGGGGGGSSLVLGTTSTTAKRGDYAPSYADVPAGSTYTILKTQAGWPARYSSRPDLTFIWVGPDPSPAIVASGTAGMHASDMRAVSGTVA